MKGKVNCTCGWSWNKSDSSAKDMYICHQCGRDNSNNIPKAQEGDIVNNATQEGIDALQTIYRNNGPSTIFGRLPFNVGSGIGLLQSKINNEPEKLSDQLGFFPNPYAQAASYVALYAEKEAENIKKFNENKYRGKDLSEIVPEEEVNNRLIDNTYIPKPKIAELKETKKKIKSKKVPYTEKKETSKVEIDNTRTVKPQVNPNYKPETKYKFNIPSITYSDKSFVMPREVNNTEIDNTYVAKTKRKNGGWLDQYASGGTMQEYQENYNDSKATASPDMVGDGFSNVGRNYSPAWGGQFQEGGSLPGSVGFTYARTKGIPSNGPYAKKTLPSAQNGQEMQYYQNGLDFKPKSISRDGGWLNKYDQAQDGYTTDNNPKLDAGKYYTTTGNVVDWGTPEYEKAYNRGEVLSEDGVRSEVTLEGGVLPEVVLQNNYKRGFFEKYKDKIIDENKDAGVLGAIIGTPISAITSLPQLAATYGITGEMQRPSEAMAIQNPYGAMAVDAIADPANLIGAGILTKEKALARLSNLKNINAEGKIFSGMNTELNNMAIQNIERYMAKRTPSNTPLSKEMNPRLLDNFDPGEYTPFQEDDYMKWFNEQKSKLNPRPVKQDPRSIVRSSSVIDINDFPNTNFKSEIDWSKWNKEIPDNFQLMDEYNAIEQTSKANGSWMKNPDGSKFQGTPEQFVQQNSENFKKAFGNSKLINPDGSPTIQYHGSAKNFDTFDESKFQLGDSGYSGRGIYTTPDKGKASSYALSSKSIHTGEYQPTVYELYGQGNNPISAEDLINQNKNYDLFNFYRSKDWRGDVPLEEQMLDYDVAIRNQTRGIERVSPWHQADELVFPKNTQLKSAVGNNGMFDMTNPNIYKSVLPIGLGLGVASQIEQKREGGIIKDDMGQWKYPGEITEIGSNQITMEGVPYDVLGISDTGDTKLMKPGKNYKFKGKKVTEFPMAKNGLRQEQKGLQNLEDLTNFTNYNKPSNWLNKYN
jgi:hypothetical protein